MFTTKAMIYSSEEQAEVTILHHKNNNDVIAEYNGIRCTAVYNPFTGLFYVDDIFGVLKNQNQCPICGEHLHL